MTRKLLFLAMLTTTLSPPPSLGSEKTRMDYGQELLRQGDTFRAISVFKEMLFFSMEFPETQRLRLKLGEAYRKSGHPISAIYYYAEALSADSAEGEVTDRAQLGLALSYAQMKVLPLAREALSKAPPAGSGLRDPFSLVEALVSAEARQYDDAWTSLSLVPGDTSWYAPKLNLEKAREQFRSPRLKQKSPVLAAVLSSVLPGSGQAYSGHYFDALQSFAFVSSLALASYATFRYEDEVDGSYVAFGTLVTVTSVFHAANIIGAIRTTQYHNYRARENVVGEFRLEVLRMDF